MSGKDGKERDGVIELAGGNVIDVLDEFNQNRNKRPDPVIEDNTDKEDVKLDDKTDGSDGIDGKNAKVDEAVTQWLIDNKFKDDAEGREALAKSYREIQSSVDKKKNEYEAKDQHYQGLNALEDYLKDNPKIVEMIQKEADNKGKPVAPEKPSDFDPLDIGTDGTPSNDWFVETQEYNQKLGALEMRQELDSFKRELAEEKTLRTESAKRRESLVSAGLDATEVDDFNTYMRNPEVSGDENLVKIYRYLSGNKPLDALVNKDDASDGENPAKRKINKTPSAAAVDGKAPKQTANEDMRQDFMASIMKHSKR